MSRIYDQGNPMFFERNKVMLGAIYAVILTGNLIVPLIFNVIQHSRQPLLLRAYEEEIISFLIGGLAVEVALLAAVTGMGIRPSYEALPAGLVATLITTATFLAGITISEGSRVPLEPTIFSLAIGLIGFSLLYLGYRQFSLWRRVILGSELDLERIGTRKQPVSIGFLMSLTGAAAFSIWLIRVSLPSESAQWPPRISALIVTPLFILLESLLILSLSMWCVLSQKIKWQAIPLQFVTIVAVPYLFAYLIKTFLRITMGSLEMSMQFSYLAGLTFFSLVTFACLRALGMLMRSHRKVDAGR
jgi:hypothetical protein